jgi:hypothetical protein
MIVVTRSDEYLKHHGILGMKWGKKNGPPYPIGVSAHSQSEKKAGWRKSLDKGPDDSDNKKKGLSDKQKKAIKIGATVAVTALATYGTYRLAKSGKLDPYIASGKSKLNKLMEKKAGDTKIGEQKIGDILKESASKTTVKGIKKLAKPESLADTIKNVNPNRGNPAYKNNCTFCSVASYLRTKGYDVIAKDTGGKQQMLGGVVENCFKGAKVIDGSAVKFGKSPKDASEMLVNKFGKNASGVCAVQLKTGGGHAFNWTIKDGIVKFFDGQDSSSLINNTQTLEIWWKRIKQNDALTIARLDNAEVVIDRLKRIIQ